MSKQASIPLVDLKAQYKGIKKEIDSAIQDILDKTAFILGEPVSTFEKRFAEFCQAKHAVGVSNGTSALKLALKACGIKQGDEVITTPHTFAATIEAIIDCGAVPKFVDINEQTYNIDAEKIDKAITERTRAILPVHLYGQTADMGPILEIAKAHSFKVIEDACQSHGAEWNSRRTGSIGDATAFSFYPGKNLGAYGDAGAVTTNDPDTAKNIILMRNHGRLDKYEHTQFGTNERIDALQAAVLSVKLNHIEEWTEQRREHAKTYNDLLKGTEVVTPFEAPWAKHVYHLYVVRVQNRDAVLQKLNSAGIQAGIHYPIPLHLQPAYKYLGYNQGDFPITEQICKEIISLPLYPEMDNGQIDFVVDMLKKSLSA